MLKYLPGIQVNGGCSGAEIQTSLLYRLLWGPLPVVLGASQSGLSPGFTLTGTRGIQFSCDEHKFGSQ